MSSALPLKTPTKATDYVLPKAKDTTPTSSKTPAEQTQQTTASSKPKGTVNPKEISSPHELTAFVENLLEHLDSKFDEMSTQMLDRMTQMSTRVDALEASIQDIINGDVTATPQSPSPSGMASGLLK